MSVTHHPSPVDIPLSGGRSYRVWFRPLSDLSNLMIQAGLRPGRCILVTDENVARLYGTDLEQSLSSAGWSPLTVTLPPGESTKAPEHLYTVYDAALSWGIDRRTPVLAFGGGVIGDLAGYAAATLLRGLPLVQIPTTLIAQVDSALGGKTGINHPAGKNLIGAFHQPHLVCADLRTLQSLPELEWTSGLAEVVKHGLIADPGLFADLMQHWDALLERRPEVIREVVPRAAAVKAGIVSQDEREQGRRAVLNFGHTFGHAIERTAGYGTFTHGEAVALGMRAALWLSARLHPEVSFDEAVALVRRIPVRKSLSGLEKKVLTDAMYADKKVDAGRLRFVVLRRPGEAYVTGDVSPEDVNLAWAAAGAH